MITASCQCSQCESLRQYNQIFFAYYSSRDGHKLGEHSIPTELARRRVGEGVSICNQSSCLSSFHASRSIALQVRITCKSACRQLWIMANEISEALNYLHNKNIVHTNLTSWDIFVTEDWAVRIANIGLIRFITGSDQCQQVPGRSRYLAPERLRGRPATFKSDIYALGVILLELYTGPDQASSSQRQEAWEEVPSTIHTVIRQCLQDNPEHRPTAASVLDIIAQAYDVWALMQLQAELLRTFILYMHKHVSPFLSWRFVQAALLGSPLLDASLSCKFTTFLNAIVQEVKKGRFKGVSDCQLHFLPSFFGCSESLWLTNLGLILEVRPELFLCCVSSGIVASIFKSSHGHFGRLSIVRRWHDILLEIKAEVQVLSVEWHCNEEVTFDTEGGSRYRQNDFASQAASITILQLAILVHTYALQITFMQCSSGTVLCILFSV